LVPAYGLAEAVLAVTMSPLGEEPTIMDLDTTALGRREVCRAKPDERNRRAVVSSGLPLPGNDVHIRGGLPLGEIVVQSPCLADGYLDAPDATTERFSAEGFLTGDLGFVDAGKLYVTGRVDDLITIAGRNIYGRDIEACLGRIEGVRPDACCVVDTEVGGTTRLVAVIEPRADHPDFSVMAEAIGMAARAGAGVTIAECVFLPKGWFPKTPSGKVQRFRCRDIAASPESHTVVRART
jgi:fatty-acyl-CoA synthase